MTGRLAYESNITRLDELHRSAAAHREHRKAMGARVTRRPRGFAILGRRYSAAAATA